MEVVEVREVAHRVVGWPVKPDASEPHPTSPGSTSLLSSPDGWHEAGKPANRPRYIDRTQPQETSASSKMNLQRGGVASSEAGLERGRPREMSASSEVRSSVDRGCLVPGHFSQSTCVRAPARCRRGRPRPVGWRCEPAKPATIVRSDQI